MFKAGTDIFSQPSYYLNSGTKLEMAAGAAASVVVARMRKSENLAIYITFRQYQKKKKRFAAMTSVC